MANIYVRAGASGSTGADWGANAYNDIPAMSAIARGDTVYVADGSYAAVTFDKAVSGSTVITIKKATVADHGTSTGWSDAYGDGQAVFAAQVWLKTDYWVFDGVSRSGWRTGYGFKVENNNGSNQPVNGTAAVQTGDYTGGAGANVGNASNITIKYVEINGSHDRTGGYNDYGLLWTYTHGRVSGNYLGYCYIHDVGGVNAHLRNTDGALVEYCWFQNNQSTASNHAEGISVGDTTSEFTFRYNYVENMEGSGYLATPSGLSGLTYTNWGIYGNVFFCNNGEANAHLDFMGEGIISLYNYSVFSGYLYIVNNTFAIGSQPGDAAPYIAFTPSVLPVSLDTVVIANNLFYGSDTSPVVDHANATIGSYTWDYNAYYDSVNDLDLSAHKSSASGNPFVDVSQTAGHVDFSLATGTAAGSTLASPYNHDLTGAVRGGDGTWDRGAYEFGASKNRRRFLILRR